MLCMCLGAVRCVCAFFSWLDGSTKVHLLIHCPVLFIAVRVVCCSYRLQQERLCSSKQGVCSCWLVVSRAYRTQMGHHTYVEK